MTTPVVLFVGSRHNRAPIGLAGLLAGNNASDDSLQRDAEEDDGELFEEFCRACPFPDIKYAWLRQAEGPSLTVRYSASGATLTVAGLDGPEEQEPGQNAVVGVWYRGLPTLPRFSSEDDQAYAERESEAFWEGYCHHAAATVLNRPRTAGMRPALWETLIVRHLVKSKLGLHTAQDGLASPCSHLPEEEETRRYQTLSTRRLARAEEMGLEHCVWAIPSSHAASVVAIHVGSDILLARPCSSGALEPLNTHDLPLGLVSSLVTATRSVAQLLHEDFGAALWEADPFSEQVVFHSYTTNPSGQALTPLGLQLFPMSWRFLTRKRR